MVVMMINRSFNQHRLMRLKIDLRSNDVGNDQRPVAYIHICGRLRIVISVLNVCCVRVLSAFWLFACLANFFVYLVHLG